jgi:hypothetical protein
MELDEENFFCHTTKKLIGQIYSADLEKRILFARC